MRQTAVSMRVCHRSANGTHHSSYMPQPSHCNRLALPGLVAGIRIRLWFDIFFACWTAADSMKLEKLKAGMTHDTGMGGPAVTEKGPRQVGGCGKIALGSAALVKSASSPMRTKPGGSIAAHSGILNLCGARPTQVECCGKKPLPARRRGQRCRSQWVPQRNT